MRRVLAAQVAWDFEYTDSVRRDQRGAMTNGIEYGRVFRKKLATFLLGLVMLVWGLFGSVMFVWGLFGSVTFLWGVL